MLSYIPVSFLFSFIFRVRVRVKNRVWVRVSFIGLGLGIGIGNLIGGVACTVDQKLRTQAQHCYKCKKTVVYLQLITAR